MKQGITQKVFNSRKQKQELLDFFKAHVGEYIMEIRSSQHPTPSFRFAGKRLYKIKEMLDFDAVILGGEILVMSPKHPENNEIQILKSDFIFPDMILDDLEEDQTAEITLTVISKESYMEELEKLTKMVLDD
jgi:hypothetical protein